MEELESTARILAELESKASLKQVIYRNSFTVFEQIKSIAKKLIDDIAPKMAAIDTSVEINFKENGAFEFWLQIAGDTIIYTLHTNVHNFPDDHAIHNSKYVQEDNTRVYCSMIEVFNFLSDSFKYDRFQDIGYMIGRIFINKENHFFVEGTRQLGFLYTDFDTMILDEVYIKAILEATIIYSIDFDLWAPAFKEVQVTSVGEMLQKTGTTPHKTGKRLGFDIIDAKSKKQQVS